MIKILEPNPQQQPYIHNPYIAAMSPDKIDPTRHHKYLTDKSFFVEVTLVDDGIGDTVSVSAMIPLLADAADGICYNLHLVNVEFTVAREINVYRQREKGG